MGSMMFLSAMWLVFQWFVLTVAREPADPSVEDLFDMKKTEEPTLADESPEFQASNVSVDVDSSSRRRRRRRSGYYYYYSSPSPSPPAPPGPGAAWPTFASSDDLEKDAWGTYYKIVFGKIPTDDYPRSPESLWMFYSKAISQAGVTDYPASVGKCPTDGRSEGQVYAVNNAYAPTDTFWSWHPYPYSAFGSHTWCEVMHEHDPYGDEQEGAWFMHTPGSAIYFNIGVTRSFSTHSEAYDHWGVTGPHWNQDMSKRAAADGYDSVQFTAHVDHVNYPCDTHNTGTPNLEYMGLEIVGVKLVGTHACTTSDGAPSSIRAGWHAYIPCKCDNSKQFLNCDGPPSTGETLAGGNFSKVLEKESARFSVQV